MLKILSILCFIYIIGFQEVTFEIKDKYISYHIHFGLDSANFLPESKPELDKIATFLLKNEKIRIEIGVHTDERWSEKYSSKIHLARARTIANYLISKGISKERLIPKSYNDKFPIFKNAKTEAEHSINRRVEFVVIK